MLSFDDDIVSTCLLREYQREEERVDKWGFVSIVQSLMNSTIQKHSPLVTRKENCLLFL